MALTLGETLAALARGQAELVIPALGQGYAAQTAGTIAGLLAMLAMDEALRPARDEEAARALAAILALEGVGLDALLAEAESRLMTGDRRVAPALLDALAQWADAALLRPPPAG